MNRYGYVGGDPLNRRDQTGLDSELGPNTNGDRLRIKGFNQPIRISTAPSPTPAWLGSSRC